MSFTGHRATLFFSVAEIKTLLDVMASQKLNTLHMHFADDETFV